MHLQVSKGNFTYWRCSKRSKSLHCPATVSQKGSEFKLNSREHIHQADKAALTKVLIRKEVKLTSLEAVHCPARRIVEDVMLGHNEPGGHELPKLENLKRLANKVRAAKQTSDRQNHGRLILK
ncbi:PREDICTED: uncharacterized protein LOC106811100 [Priapulus caudatus]|uniref:Uncharacterized protein LOC106811100 n=1 Tax=Priapulus caudatus TaxID=37621 RepID=A0ABM1ED48_PRICU|nr:PREDICTED: uncharacterized protein LOC106811100 [Priapulus caudatus]